jgi:hypothetical protein
VSLISGVEYLGSSSPDRLRERFLDRRRVTPAERGLGERAWSAFRSSDPSVLEDLLEEDTTPLPFLRGAVLRHLEQFPSVTNGLSRSEAQALETIAGGVTRLGCVYVASHHEREEAVFLGDAVFALYIEGLSRVRDPLVVRADGHAFAAPRGPATDREFWDSEARLTKIGQAVLEGREDRVGRNGIERWLGGVHLSGPEARWRWDPSARRLESAGGEGRS